jgi:hypothetical protein
MRSGPCPKLIVVISDIKFSDFIAIGLCRWQLSGISTRSQAESKPPQFDSHNLYTVVTILFGFCQCTCKGEKPYKLKFSFVLLISCLGD